MRIEEFLKTGGLKYDLWVLGTEDDKIKIEIKTDKFDGDGCTQYFLVKDNMLFPIEEK
jgi:hypothetical protein